MADDILSPGAQERARERLEEWVAHHISKHLAPLLALHSELQEEAAEPPAPGAMPEQASEAARAPSEATSSETADADASEPGEEAAPDASDAVDSGATPEAAVASTATAASKQQLKGMARGLAFRLYENLGSVARAAVARDLRAIEQGDRAPLRRLGVRFGAFSIFLPALVKPGAARLKALLWAVHQGISDVPPPPPAGLTSIAADASIGSGFYEAAGFRSCGPRAVRIDMLERLGDLIRAKGANKQMPESFAASPDMMSILGCGEEDLTLILRSIGFRDTQEKKADGSDSVIWKLRNRREERQNDNSAVERKSFRKQRPQAAARGDGASEPQPKAPHVARSDGEHHAKGPRLDTRSETRPDKGPRKGPRPQHKKPDEQRAERKSEQRPAEPRREKPFKVDPDSPFAALAALKFRK